MAITDSMLRAALPGIGMLAERVGLDAMLYVRGGAARDAVVLMESEKSGRRRQIGSFADSLSKRRVRSAQNMYDDEHWGVASCVGCRTGCRRRRSWSNESMSGLGRSTADVLWALPTPFSFHDYYSTWLLYLRNYSQLFEHRKKESEDKKEQGKSV